MQNINKDLLIEPVLILSRYPFSVDQNVPETDWEVYLRETANAIVSQQSPQRYVRGKEQAAGSGKIEMYILFFLFQINGSSSQAV